MGWEVLGYAFAIGVAAVMVKVVVKLWGPSKFNRYDLPGQVAGVNECLFCGFVREMRDFVYEDEHVLVFNDISPFAATHLLVIPKRHIKNLMALKENDLDLLMHMQEVAEGMKLRFGSEAEFVFHRSAFNSVLHLHLHVMVYPVTRPVMKRILFGSMFSTTIEAVIAGLKSKNS